MSAGPALPAPGGGERRVAARGVAWGGIESAASALVGLLLTPLVLRHTGLEGLGLWGAAWSVAHTAGLIDLGVGASYGRFAARALARRDLDDLNGLLGAGVGFHLMLSLLFGIPALLLGPACLAYAAPGHPLLPEARQVVTCTLLTVMARGTLQAYRGVIGGAQRLDLLGRLGAAAAIIEGCGGALALHRGLGLTGMALNSLGVALATSLAEAIVAHRLCPGLRVRPFAGGTAQFKRILSFGARLQVTRAFEILGAHAPRLLLAAGPGLAAAGAYDLGARAAGLVQLLASLPLRVIMPLTGHLETRGDRERLQELLSRATRYVGLLALLPCALLLLDAGTILLAWTGSLPPHEAVFAARCLAASLAVSLLAAPLRLVLRGSGHPGVETLATSCGTLAQIGVGVLLMQLWDARGMAAGALAGALVATALLWRGATRTRSDIDPRLAGRALLGALAAAAATIAIGLLLDPLAAAPPILGAPGRLEGLEILAWRAPLLSSLFLGAAVFTGGFKRQDTALLRDVISITSHAGAPR